MKNHGVCRYCGKKICKNVDVCIDCVMQISKAFKHADHKLKIFLRYLIKRENKNV